MLKSLLGPFQIRSQNVIKRGPQSTIYIKIEAKGIKK